MFAAGVSAQYYGGYPRNPYNYVGNRAYGFGYNSYQSRWNPPMSNAQKVDAWLNAFDGGDAEKAASFFQPGHKFIINGADVGPDISDPEVVAGLPSHTHSDRYYTAAGNDVVVTMTANYPESSGKPANVEMLRLHFNAMGKIDELFNISPVPPACDEEASDGMLTEEESEEAAPEAAPKKSKKNNAGN